MKQTLTSALLVTAILASSFTMKSCSQSENAENGEGLPTEGENTELAEEASGDATGTPAGTMVEISTDYGTMKAVLYDETPQHRDNFIKLAKEGFYDGTLFHRVIKGFMIQGGDPDSKTATPGQQLGGGGPGYTIPAEFNSKFYHKKGALSAARQSDQVNPEKASSGSQFYIVHGTVTPASQLNMMAEQMKAQQRNMAVGRVLQSPGHEADMAEYQKLVQARDEAGYNALVLRLQPDIDKLMASEPAITFSEAQKTAYATVGGAPNLDGAYTVFGEVVEGLEVIDAIANAETAPGDRPVKDVKMTIKVVE